MTGTRWTSHGEHTSSVLTKLHMVSRAVVETTTVGSATVLAITDSVTVWTNDKHAGALAEQSRLWLQGKQTRLHLATDGTVTMAHDGPTAPPEHGEIMASIPAAFPRTAVRVGESWVREMPLPAGSGFGARAGDAESTSAGKVRAVFQLDSLSRDGDRAYLSMRGEVNPEGANAVVPLGAMLQQGTVTGTMLLDRRRGWLTESQFLIDVHSVVTPPAGSSTAPMRIQLKITQRTRTLAAR